MTLDPTIAGKNQRQQGDVLSISGVLRIENAGNLRIQTQTVVATGTNAATGAVLGQGINNVTGADGTKVIVLPTPANTDGGDVVVINNAAAKNLPLYPNVAGGASINGSSSSATIGSSNGTIAWCYDGTNWFLTPKTPS